MWNLTKDLWHWLFDDLWIGVKLAWKDPLFHVVLAFMAIFFIALASYSSSSRGADLAPEQDRWGFIYPKECRGDLSWIKAKIIYSVNLNERFGPPFANGGRRLGYYEAPIDSLDSHTIYVDARITDPAIRAEVLRHELCHALWYMKYGDARWHAE